jgi:tripartite-type tricarboxylate transporter receptor subunit TctC
LRLHPVETLARRGPSAFLGTIAALFVLCHAAPLWAQTADAFPRSVQLIIGFGPGGNYDLWGRTLARHIGKHLPGRPNVVPQYMPGAGSYVAAGHMANVAARDGSAIAIIARDAVLGPLTGASGALFDPQKLSWLGSPVRETNICMAYRGAKVTSAKDLFETQLIVADTGPGTGTRTYPKVLSELLGMKFKIVSGFRSSSDVFLAMERGEVEGFCESLDSVRNRRPDWIANKTVTILFQGGAQPHPDLAGIPFVPDLARTAEERQVIEFLYAGQGIGRPFVAPPSLAPERLKTLREAFMATMSDPEFVTETKKSGLFLDPVSGGQLAMVVDRIYATPKAIVEKMSAMMK